jgi:hypothetical protein
VANLIGEIQTLTVTEKWRFLPGKLNPADAANSFSTNLSTTFALIFANACPQNQLSPIYEIKLVKVAK